MVPASPAGLKSINYLSSINFFKPILKSMLFLRDRRPSVVRQTFLAMKLIVILLIAGFLQASAKTNAQNVTLSGKDIPLEQVFKRIQSQTPYVFFYDAGLLKSSHPVTLNLKNVSALL